MSFLSRVVAAIALVALVLSPPARGELVTMKSKRAFLASASDEVVAGGAKDRFREPIFLKAEASCVVLRFSGEISGTNHDVDPHVLASFDLAVDDTLVAAPIFHEAPTISIPRLVSIDGYACGLPAGPHEVTVRVRGEVLDVVTVRARTLEVWTGSGRAVSSTIGVQPASQ